MKASDNKYASYSLVNEMLETVELVRNFKYIFSHEFHARIKHNNKLFISGEGSSRIFPANHLIYQSMRRGISSQIYTEGCLQAKDYNLDGFNVFGISNSGKTKELIELFNQLKNSNHIHLAGLSCHQSVPLEALSKDFFFLDCGEEKAVAATKSVICQALFLETMFQQIWNVDKPDLNHLADGIEQCLVQEVDKTITEILSQADTVYFSGKNDGVAEELTLKTNEITRQRSGFLPGTYLLHGIEEVVTPGDVIVLIEPYRGELEKIKTIYEEEIGAKVIAVSSHRTPFPTLQLPSDNPEILGYLALTAGWNVLVETGLALGINPDKPKRARKIGNEFITVQNA